MKKTNYLLSIGLSVTMFLNPLLFARPLLVNSDIEVIPGPSSGGYTGADGKFRCMWGCGEQTSPNGEGWGYGKGSGKGDSPDIDRSTGRGNESGNSGDGPNSGGGGEKGKESRKGGSGSMDPYIGRERQERTQDPEEAWKVYREQVNLFNDKWMAELSQKYQAQNKEFTANSELVNEWSKSKIPEIKINPNSNGDIGQLIDQSLPPQLDGYQYLSKNKNEFGPLLDYQYQSSHKDELNKIRLQHANIDPKTPQAYYAYKAGLESLKEADDAYSENLEGVGNFFKTASGVLFDIATDINPISGLSKDLYRVFSGKDPFSGEVLSPLERLLSGGFALVAMGTLGQSAVFEAGLRRFGSFVKASANDIVGTTKLLEAAGAKFPNLRKTVEFLKKNGLDKEDRGKVIRSFSGDTKVVTLSKDTTVYRYSNGGSSKARGRWLTPERVKDPKVELALPGDGPFMEHTWTIPEGTEVVEGLIAPQFNQLGGGKQIFIPDDGVLR